MARNADTIDYRDDYYKGPAKIYFDAVLNNIISIGDLDKEIGLILDFGCGVGQLKKRLKEVNIVGYDIIPELSDVKQYNNLKPDKIVLSGVLEHLSLDEINNLLIEFQAMNPFAQLLVFLPTENFISKIAMYLAGQKNAHDDHISKYKDINKLIEKYYFPEKRKYIFFRMSQITKYVPLEKNTQTQK